VSVFLCTATSPDPTCKAGQVTTSEIETLQTKLQHLPNVVSVTTVSQPQALANFKAAEGSNSAFASTMTASELPPSFEVKTQNSTADDPAVVQAMAGAPGVDQSIDETSILAKFFALLNGLRNAVVIVALILTVAAILLVANTIRLSAFNRRRETGIMRLVGASDFYIQLPFLLEGIIAGLLGWVVAAIMLYGVKSLVLDSLQQYFSQDVGLSTGDMVEVILLAMVIGIALTGATSFLTLRRYLKV
jgi:cell division transport system permease protein